MSKLTREECMALYDQLMPHIEAIERLFKNPRVTLLVRAPDLPDGDLMLTQDDEATICEAVRRQMAKKPAIEQDAIERVFDIKHVI